MKQSKLQEPYVLNATGQEGMVTGSYSAEKSTGSAETNTNGSASTPWYGYIGQWLGGVGSLIASTKDPADINYYNYGNSGNSSGSATLWILVALAVVLVMVMMGGKK